jgi:hypothetical protein
MYDEKATRDRKLLQRIAAFAEVSRFLAVRLGNS